MIGRHSAKACGLGARAQGSDRGVRVYFARPVTSSSKNPSFANKRLWSKYEAVFAG